MKEAKAVIGKNFGDEGKGAAVNALCRGKRDLVVRHNGGAQAGHTVEEGDFRFVFHQLGSGSLQGCPTFWAKTFLPDLFKLGEEMEAWGKVSRNRDGGICRVYADRDCACVTVYDVLLNQMEELLRGEGRHGSCGMGIFEAVRRAEAGGYGLYLRDFENTGTDRIEGKLKRIRDGYAMRRLKELQRQYPGRSGGGRIRELEELAADGNVLHNAAMEMYENFQRYVVTADWQGIAGKYDMVVFENAQGLMLDWENEGYAPHLTASYTGLRNVVGLLEEAEGKGQTVPLEAVYVTRTYVTRHGAGRLDHECGKGEINREMADMTNIPNPWQGSLRYGKHPAGEDFFRYIRRDLEWIGQERAHAVKLCLTHMDETGGKVLFSDGAKDFEEFCMYCREHMSFLQPWILKR